MTQNREQVEAGCAISYGVKLLEMHGLAAVYTDKMLKGARPKDTPAQQPANYELIINQRTVKGLGIELPAPFLAEADEVIEWVRLPLVWRVSLVRDRNGD
jgi:putative tryptophan/tyrosine transport system substrate-binding protein